MMPDGGGRAGQGRVPGNPGQMSAHPAGPALPGAGLSDAGVSGGGLSSAAVLGLPALASVVEGAQDGITVCAADRRFVYANPAACQMLGYPLEQLRGRDFLDILPAREHAFGLARFAERRGRSAGDSADPFAGILRRPDGSEREVITSTFPIDIAGEQHGVTIFRDVTVARAAARAAAALAQTAAQLASGGTTGEILAAIARHAVAGTRAVACGIDVLDDHKLVYGGGYGPERGLDYGDARSADRASLADVSGEEVIKAMTGGSITIDGVPGTPVVLPDARSAWETNPVTKDYAAKIKHLNWQAGVYAPLAWENKVFGLFEVYLPAGLTGPSEEELAFYTALSDQAAVAVTNAQLAAQARQAAAQLERTRLARELHDSVSQALFSMTMHARAAQLSMAKAGLDQDTPLGRSVAELTELTRGALAEMRALIFELRPAALAEEGLVAAVRKQAAALTARERVVITVAGPEERLELEPGVEEHLYRIVSEALHNVVKHAAAGNAEVAITAGPDVLRVVVSDHGVGFEPEIKRAGHLGLSTMAERAALIGADLAITSSPGAGATVTVSLRYGEPRQEPADSGGRPRLAAGDGGSR